MLAADKNHFQMLCYLLKTIQQFNNLPYSSFPEKYAEYQFLNNKMLIINVNSKLISPYRDGLFDLHIMFLNIVKILYKKYNIV